MNHMEQGFTGQNGLRIYWQAWLPATAPRAAVVIAHGLGEHGGRYARVAQTLVERGLAVYAIDH
ncbi:MAG: alpha/beta hydrolase, partial [Salinisphaera sp.]|nr:alpha/beta hydrolase [Salinisphaera sp.]